MRHIVRNSLLATLTALLSLSGCSKEESIRPESKLLEQSQSQNGAEQHFDYRTNTHCFGGVGEFNLTGLPSEEPCVEMVRKNFVEINGVKITQTWSGKIDINMYPSLQALNGQTYQWNGEFVDRDIRALGYIWKVSFTVDAAGNASANLRWTGGIVKDVTPL